MNLFERIFRELNKSKVKYLVVGGVAVNLHGYIRFTGDLDLLLLLNETNVQRMDKVMRKLKYSPRLPIPVTELGNKKRVQMWSKEKNMKAFTFIPSKDVPLEIDIIIEESLKFDAIAQKKAMKYIEEVKIPVVAIEDLLKMKKKSGRANDLQDIQALTKLKRL